MAKKKKVEKPSKIWNPSSKKDLHEYFFLMPEWYNSENLKITKPDIPKVIKELKTKFNEINEDYIIKLVKKYKSKNVIGTYTEADPEAGKEFEE